MIIPMRCYTCGKPISHLYRKYASVLQNVDDPVKCRAEVMNKLGLKRYCCRRIFLTHRDILPIIHYSTQRGKVRE